MSCTEISVSDVTHKPYIATTSENADKHPQPLSTPLLLIPGRAIPAAPLEKPQVMEARLAPPEIPGCKPSGLLLHRPAPGAAGRREGEAAHSTPGRAEARTARGALCGVRQL